MSIGRRFYMEGFAVRGQPAVLPPANQKTMLSYQEGPHGQQQGGQPEHGKENTKHS